jgi:ATP-binding cassette subfamily B protein
MVRNLSDGGFVAINGVIGAILITTLKVPAFLPFFLILGPCGALLIIKLRRKLNAKNELFRSEIEVMSARVNEMTTLIPITRAHGLEKSALQVMYESFSNVKRAGLSLDSFNANFNAMAWVTFSISERLLPWSRSVLRPQRKVWCHYRRCSSVDLFLSGQLIGAVILISSLMPQIAKGFSSIRSLG